MNNNGDFFKIYNSGLKKICMLSSTELKIFLHLCQKMRYDSGEVLLTADDRKVLALTYHIKVKTLYNVLSSLVKKGVLYKRDIFFYVNTDVAEKGGIARRARASLGL